MNEKKRDKSTLEQTFDGIRDGHSGFSDQQWRERLQLFLQKQDGATGPVRVTEISRPASGLSVVNIIFKAERGGVEARYVARVEPEKSFFVKHNLAEQFEAYHYLHSIALPVPDALWMDADGQYLGRPGFVMEFSSGESATTSYFTDGGPICRASVEQRVRMLHNMVKIIARVHNNADPFAVASLASKGRGEGWLEREINHWHDIAMEAHPGLSKFYDPVREWLVATAPPVPDPVFVHGDFNASNVLWDGEGISAILDLESIRIGPRESDIVYQYLIDRLASSFFTTGVDVPSLAERTAWYKEASGVELDHLGYHETRISFQLSCAAVAIARYEKRDLAVMPTPFMDFLNRRLMLMEFFKHQMPIIGS